MRITVALLILFWSAAAMAQQFEDETRAPTPGGQPEGPPPPGTGEFPPGEPGTEAERPRDPPPPPASRPPAPAPGTPPPSVKTDAPNVVAVHKDQGGYALLVDGKPTMVFGMNWGYMPIGQNYTYDFWSKPDEIIVEALEGEMRLMKEMGVNVVRQYVGVPARWIAYIYETYGIYTACSPSAELGHEGVLS